METAADVDALVAEREILKVYAILMQRPDLIKEVSARHPKIACVAQTVHEPVELRNYKTVWTCAASYSWAWPFAGIRPPCREYPISDRRLKLRGVWLQHFPSTDVFFQQPPPAYVPAVPSVGLLKFLVEFQSHRRVLPQDFDEAFRLAQEADMYPWEDFLYGVDLALSKFVMRRSAAEDNAIYLTMRRWKQTWAITRTVLKLKLPPDWTQDPAHAEFIRNYPASRAEYVP